VPGVPAERRHCARAVGWEAGGQFCVDQRGWTEFMDATFFFDFLRRVLFCSCYLISWTIHGVVVSASGALEVAGS
jgi:hypothetical protein